MSKTTELTVNGLWAALEDNGIDFNELRLMTRPEGIDDWGEAKRQQWLRPPVRTHRPNRVSGEGIAGLNSPED